MPRLRKMSGRSPLALTIQTTAPERGTKPAVRRGHEALEAIFAFLLISGPVGAMIEPGHQVVVAGKLAPLEPAPLENVAVLLRDNKDKVDLPLQCRLLPAAAQGEGLQPLQLINEVCRQGIQRGRESIAASSLRLLVVGADQRGRRRVLTGNATPAAQPVQARCTPRCVASTSSVHKKTRDCRRH